MKYVAVLRGINVSGQKKIVMQDLKALFEKLDFEAVTTYIQSGNVVFTNSKQDTRVLAEQIKAQIKITFSFDVSVIIRQSDQISNIIKQCPFGEVDIEKNGTKVMLSFLSDKPDVQAVKALFSLVKKPEEMYIIDQEVYLFCPNGYGKTKLHNNFIERKLAVNATTRNWKTMLKLNELCLQ